VELPLDNIPNSNNNNNSNIDGKNCATVMYTITYDPNGADSAPESVTETSCVETIIAETPNRNGYIFFVLQN